MRRRAILGALAALPATPALAQPAWPNRPIRIIVPYPPGGPNDIIARLYAPALTAALGQTVLIENRAGGSGVIGTDYVLKSPPDGYVVGIVDGGSLTIAPHTQPSMPYRVPEDVSFLSVVTKVPEALVASPAIGAKTLPELLDLAKRRPGTLNIGTAGAAGISHLTALRFRIETGAQVEVVPYRGAAPAVTDLVAGQIQLLFADLPVILPHIKAGAITAIALAARQRSPSLPELRTTVEYGVPRLLAENWYCAVAPRGLPAEIAATLSAALKTASGTASVKDGLFAQGAEAAWTTPQDFAALARQESADWRQIVGASGVKAE
ncbi:Bug family tripartite tricarboxylate transporter substrate binding protein [Paracraurococcus lichenis]|uniref:Tripartite tricarboxylate transporter substrate-binding protein n=1 Tax=Paracraurococcus lichenis TaxID=3064888 RepID=A0ABT9DSG7_9PROT|nr:tripartite tricarboxylate transporter substrate-binding protein [Paracraurococcus sp. LOR1-02]MDO9706849.1 tripartite tricarboxylate transporter substrate-binding protein [Paracraurococcus sp. LOR1-02]